MNTPTQTAAKAILIVGPGEAKTGFKAWLEHKHPAIAANVWDVQSADHPTEGQLAAMAREKLELNVYRAAA